MKKYKDTVLLLRVSHLINCLLYVCSVSLFGVGMYFALVVGPSSSTFRAKAAASPEDYGMMIGIMAFFAVLFIAIIILYIVAIVVAGKRSEVNWVFQLVVSALGVTNIITAIPYILAIMNLTDPEVKKYFENKEL